MAGALGKPREHAAPGIKRHVIQPIQDAVSDAVVRAFAHADTLRDESKFKPWILRITARCCYDLLRRNKLETPQDTVELPGQQPAVFTTSSGVFDGIQALPAGYRQIMLLYYHDGLKAKEIAGILDCPLSTVLMRISGRQKQKNIGNGGCDAVKNKRFDKAVRYLAQNEARC